MSLFFPWFRNLLAGFVFGAVAFGALPAYGATTCMSPAEFNADAAKKGYATTAGTLKYRVTGIDPNAGKGALAMFLNTVDKNAGGVPCVGTYLKVYGPGEDLGKVKNELANVCCTSCDSCSADRSGAVGCETWSGEARSSVIFTSPSQVCDVEARFSPSEHSYAISCDDGKGDSGIGANTYAMTVNEVYVLEGPGGMAALPGATLVSQEFCFESPDASGGGGGTSPTPKTLSIPVSEDVTVDGSQASSVYPDTTDLSVGQTEQVFMKFVVPSTVGTITKATLSLTNSGEPSAEGDGASLYAVASNAWSEASLTWSAKPERAASSLGHVGPVAQNQVVTFDVASATKSAGTYSFVLAAEAADLNGTHFHAKESSAANAPVLTIEYLDATASGAASANDPAEVTPSSADKGEGSGAGPLPSGSRTASQNGCGVTSRAASSAWTFAPLLLFAASVLRRRRNP